MSPEELNALEVRPERAGWYLTTLFQFDKLDATDPDYRQAWLEFDGARWDYIGALAGTCYVCFIHQRYEGGM